MDDLPQYLQILSHRGNKTNEEPTSVNKWTQLIYLANSGWLGTNPRSIFTNRYNSNYIDKLLELPLGIPNDVYTSHHSNDGDSKLGWASNLELDNDDDGTMGFYYGGDQPSNDVSDADESDYTWRRVNEEEFDEEVEEEEEEDSDDTPVIITRGVPFYTLLGRRFNNDNINHNNHHHQADDQKETRKNDDEEEEDFNETIPFKLIPHRDVYIGNDDETIMIENGIHLKVNRIYLKPECALVSADSNDIREKTILTPLYSLRTSVLSTPFPHLITNQNVKLYENSDLIRKLNSERRLIDEESLYTSFISSTCIPNGIGIYYYEVKLLNVNLNINDGISIGCSSLSPSKIENDLWCDDSIKTERLNVMWEAKSGKLCYHNDLKTYNPHTQSRFQQQARDNWPKYTKGDTIGFGIDFVKGKTFGTKNGVLIGESSLLAMINNDNIQYVTINLGIYSEVDVNLGGSCFQFDILNYVRDKKIDVMNKVNSEPFIPFSIPDGEIVKDDLSISHFVDKLVLGYLKHRGYVETALELSKELQEDNDNNWNWQEISNFKKTLKALLIKDQIDEIMNLITIKFPNFWLTYERIEFKLLCFKYIKLIVESKNNDLRIKKVLRFGKILNRKFSGNEANVNELNEITQFLAYENPRDCPKWDQIVNLGKERILEALIMAISETVGLSCLTGFDLGLLKADVNLESLKRHQRKDLALIDILNDYIKL